MDQSSKLSANRSSAPAQPISSTIDDEIIMIYLLAYKVRKLRLAAFAAVSEYLMTAPRVKMGGLKWAYQQGKKG